jgi:hypothetical protein
MVDVSDARHFYGKCRGLREVETASGEAITRRFETDGGSAKPETDQGGE